MDHNKEYCELLFRFTEVMRTKDMNGDHIRDLSNALDALSILRSIDAIREIVGSEHE